jgi:hypothetical protein
MYNFLEFLKLPKLELLTSGFYMKVATVSESFPVFFRISSVSSFVFGEFWLSTSFWTPSRSSSGFSGICCNDSFCNLSASIHKLLASFLIMSGSKRNLSGSIWIGSSSGKEAAEMIGLKFPDSERFWLMADMASGDGDLPFLKSMWKKKILMSIVPES